MTVHFIGAGPGAADLLTLRAAELLRTSPVCVYAGTYIDDAVLAHCPDDVRKVDTARMDLDAITAELVAAHERGEDVARLCSGDPSLYSALAEQSARLDRAGVPWDVTPGVPAYAAAAATLRVELTVPEVTQSVVLTRTQARSTAMPDAEALTNFAATGATLVLHLAITRARVLADELVEFYGSDCPAAVVFHASKPDQLVLTGTLADIADQVEAAGLRQAAVILVGPAVGRTPGVESHLYDACRERPGVEPAERPERPGVEPAERPERPGGDA
ncbi:precorrin-4 C(11)-methyltransferase [Rhodococcus sp. BP-252]|uniref:precorrin-4 C(11)-methyltransferase n=1 Tax=unclassified Rhodococcus (in: high G+C Gram-positive bacteria) TaxID=192944 RepID=UPI001C9B3E87|nr:MULTISPECIES: precorrin-4 C(11)-methyltransferase [unclassified Rhodococcus (in: high G+C Gram-positive bacteria)]MBY6410606.1 precorrin-4 C(11)-methyltransferase [Rhodococcus sp. BP-320]MBY6415569.1 precorrin-4 C(11)-methyltransferase [Rhodococcus sp. BP-321]MBY6424390.1 precorrin-4 C(11)-methyltransferase [Rhodococcus sp. BP-324]MBY6425162.1 precorrin-4 C(11)-methyltransferase [Rhodococcus sp. BP-323]MBY6430775.1 precorrin-4 C(11)-methyltransferase [Rhodococcus sp. BP-322]